MVQIDTRRTDSVFEKPLPEMDPARGLSKWKELRQVDLDETSAPAWARDRRITSRRALWLSA
jgi:hypothetical protein